MSLIIVPFPLGCCNNTGRRNSRKISNIQTGSASSKTGNKTQAKNCSTIATIITEQTTYNICMNNVQYIGLPFNYHVTIFQKFLSPWKFKKANSLLKYNLPLSTWSRRPNPEDWINRKPEDRKITKWPKMQKMLTHKKWIILFWT